MSIIFFDKDRVPIGGEILGPWHGTFGWRRDTADWHVPQQARFATVIVGLTGGVGELALDDLTLHAGASKAAAGSIANFCGFRAAGARTRSCAIRRSEQWPAINRSPIAPAFPCSGRTAAGNLCLTALNRARAG